MKRVSSTFLALFLVAQLFYVISCGNNEHESEPQTETPQKAVGDQTDSTEAKKGKEKLNQLTGCICAIDQGKNTIKVIPRNEDKESWEFEFVEWFSIDDETKIDGLKDIDITISDLKVGQAVEMARVAGIQGGEIRFKRFEIVEISNMIGERATIHWVEEKGKRIAKVIEMQIMFKGESMPAMIGMETAQVIGSGKCPCVQSK